MLSHLLQRTSSKEFLDPEIPHLERISERRGKPATGLGQAACGADILDKAFNGIAPAFRLVIDKQTISAMLNIIGNRRTVGVKSSGTEGRVVKDFINRPRPVERRIPIWCESYVKIFSLQNTFKDRP